MPSTLSARLSNYSQLMRLEKPIGTLLLLWPTLWALWLASKGSPSWQMLGIFITGTFLMRSAGCVVNDIADRRFDGQVARTKNRPFARGAVSVREALLLAGALAATAALLLIPLNTLSRLLALVALFIAATYPFTKRFLPLPQAYLGLAFSFGIPMVYAAIQNQLPFDAWLLLIANLFWTIAYDTEYAITDKPDDLKIGIKTSAITFGDYDVFTVMLCHAVFIACMVWLGVRHQLSWPYWLALMCALLLIGRQFIDIRHRDRQKCFKAFLDNNRVGGILFAGLAIHYLWIS